MAKAKKQAPVIEEQKIEPEVVVTETPEILNTPPVEEKEEDLSLQVFVQKDGEGEYKKAMEFNIPKDDKVMEAEHKERTEAIVDLTKEEKIVKFIENSTGKLVKLNDFLKSLYPALNHGEPPVWKQQITSRQIKLMLMKMENAGLIKIVNNVHSELGNPYFKGEEQRSAHYDIDTLQLFAEKI